MADQEYKPVNVDKDPLYNREPGIVKVPGSNLAKEMSKFEQFPSEWGSPGNPYMFRPFPKMLYRAQLWNGKAFCMAPDPRRAEFNDINEYKNKVELARQFNQECQRIVKDDAEMSRAMEDGWRESPDEAVAYLKGREQERADVTAMRQHEDRNMSEMAQREAARAVADAGGEHMPEIPRTPVARRKKVTRRKKT